MAELTYTRSTDTEADLRLGSAATGSYATVRGHPHVLDHLAGALLTAAQHRLLFADVDPRDAEIGRRQGDVVRAALTWRDGASGAVTHGAVGLRAAVDALNAAEAATSAADRDQQIADLTAEAEGLRGHIDRLGDQVERLIAERNELATALDREHEIEKRHVAELVRARAEVERLKADEPPMLVDETFTTQLAERDQQITRLTTELDTLRTNHTALTANRNHLIDRYESTRHELRQALTEIQRLRDLLALDPTCDQCGKPYADRACGPTHAMTAAGRGHEEADGG